MENYDDQLKRQILRLKFNIKLREFVSFLFLRYRALSCLVDWIEILEKQLKYKDHKDFLEFLRYIAHLPNDHIKIDAYFTNVYAIVNQKDVSDDLLLDMLRFIDLKNYS